MTARARLVTVTVAAILVVPGMVVTANTAIASPSTSGVVPANTAACGNFIDHRPVSYNGYVEIRHWVPCINNTIRMRADVVSGLDTTCKTYTFSSTYQTSDYSSGIPGAAYVRGLYLC